jgi:hypothetical protein
MIQALLEGRKTQTRRLLKSPVRDRDIVFLPEHSDDPAWYGENPSRSEPSNWGIENYIDYDPLPITEMDCPYGEAGDLLWVRETWRRAGTEDGHNCFSYQATKTYQCGKAMPAGNSHLAWKPSIHMPRIASRLSLEISDVRVRRLQEISVEDAIAEGLLRGDPLPELPDSHGTIWSSGVGDLDTAFAWTRNPVAAYADIWRSINGADSWDENPWVWALTFKVHQQNVDVLLQTRESA